MAQLWGDEFANAWSCLGNAVVDKQSGFEHYYGKNLFQYFAENPPRATLFQQAMHALSEYLYPEVAKLIHLADNEIIADIGGGHGFLLEAILANNPNNQGILFDQPEVIQVANRQSLISSEC